MKLRNIFMRNPPPKKQWEGEGKRNVYIRYQDLNGKLWPFTNIHTDNNYPVQAKFIIRLKKQIT